MKLQYWLLALLTCVFYAHAAPTGYCVPDNGKYHNYLNFTEQFSITDNIAGTTTLIDVNNNNTSFKGTCYCLTGPNQSYDHTYITSVVNPALEPAGSRNNVAYFNLNENVDIGLLVYILGVGYTAVPFDHLPNKTGTPYQCHNGVSSATSFYSGGSGLVYLYVKKAFTGVMTIPATLVANIYATIDPRTVSNEIISDVIVQGTVTVPQSCEIDGGQAIVFDFNKILASEFSSTKGKALTDRKITRTVNIKCTNMMFYDKLDATLHASAVASDNSMIATDNEDVGIKVYDKYNREVNTNGGALEAETTKIPDIMGDTLGTLTFSSAPASATGARPKPGQFNATATLTIEIAH